MLKRSKIPILFLLFIALNIIKIVIAGNYQDTIFSFDRYAGITEPRAKMDFSSVYLDLSNAEPKGEVVRVYIIDSGADIIRSNGGDFFRCELGKKYFLYNTVKENGGSYCRIYITGHPKEVSGKWSPDSIQQSGVITLKKAYSQSDAELSSERANDVLSALFGNINIHFTTFDQTYNSIVGQFYVQASLKSKVTISSDCKMSCSISHSIYVYGKEYTYNPTITFKDNILNSYKDLLNKLLNENPKNFFDRVKFAMRDGSVTLIPLGDLSFKIVLEFKRNPSRYQTNTGGLEITVTYLGSPPFLKQCAFEKVKGMDTNAQALPMERAFSVISNTVIIQSGYYLLSVIAVVLISLA